MANLISKVKVYAKNILALNQDDVFLVSFPKSGNTWVRFYLCNLINNIPASHFTDDVISFKVLDETMPELNQNDLAEPWPHKGFPRIIKTHLAYKSILGKRRSILIVRDPRDVMVSYFKFETTKTTPRFTGNNISEFIKHPKFGVEVWCRHLLSWQKHSAMIIKYEDLKERDTEIFAAMNKFLGVAVDEDIFLRSVNQSRFENIKKIEEAKGMTDPLKGGSNFKFARSGKTGQWKDMLNENDVQYISDTLKKFSINLYTV